MDFYIWLLSIKHFRTSVSECEEAFKTLPKSEKDKLHSEYVLSGYDG
jgi:hypothetical protein